MKSYELQGPDGAEGFRLVDRPVPHPAAGQVLVRMKAATLNYRDLLTVKGGYGSRQKFPLIPVSDGAGTVESVGAGVRQFAAGDRVVGSFFQNWLASEPSDAKMHAALGGSVDGVLTEYRVFPAHALVKTLQYYRAGIPVLSGAPFLTQVRRRLWPDQPSISADMACNPTRARFLRAR